MKISRTAILLSLSIFSGLLVAKEAKKEMIAFEYKLSHDTCEKEKCQSEIISKGKMDLVLDKESNEYFWKYEPINVEKDNIEIAIRFKAAASFEKNTKRSLEVGFSEKQKADKKQISWGEGIIENTNWANGVSMIVKGNEYQLDNKVISPSVSIQILKK
ncbi:MAG: hypothetical protein K2Q18_05995 [Bdellovibrionales bacterium]|nr:hypothetical protein [Bdellovibrionales bacterium]